MCVRITLKQLMEHKYMQNSLTQALTTLSAFYDRYIVLPKKLGAILSDACGLWQENIHYAEQLILSVETILSQLLTDPPKWNVRRLAHIFILYNTRDCSAH